MLARPATLLVWERNKKECYMPRTYEVMFILRPDLPSEEADQLVAGLQNIATHAGASFRQAERLGKRRLAYEIGRFRDGEYVLFDLEAPPEAVRELERRLRVTESVIKYLTVRTDELEKRLAQDRRHREARARRKPAPAPAAAAPEAPAMPAPAIEPRSPLDEPQANPEPQA